MTWEKRRAYRIPVIPSMDLRVRIATDAGDTWEGKPVDVSLTGMLLGFPSKACPRFRIGENVDVEFFIGNKTAQLVGEVARIVSSEHQYGFHFREMAQHKRSSKKQRFKEIVMALQLEYLRARDDEESG